MGRLCSQMLRARQFARQAVPCGRRAFTSGKTMRAGVKYENMTIGIVKESLPLERRVAQSPQSVGKLVKEGFKVVVEKNAGALSTFSDAMYEAAGATIVDSKAAWSADFVTKVRIPTSAEAAKVENRTLLSFLTQPNWRRSFAVPSCRLTSSSGGFRSDDCIDNR